MSGRGRSGGHSGRGSGQGRSGRGHQRSNGKSNTNNTNKSSSTKEIEFTPFYAGKIQVATYDTVKDHIINTIQKTYRNGHDLTKVLVLEKDYDDKEQFCDKLGLALLAQAGTETVTQGDTTMTQQREPTQYELIEYKEALREQNDRWRIYLDNKHKSYAFIWSKCNKTMQSRIETDSEFATKVKDDPFELLRRIKIKMYGPSKVKFAFLTLTDQLEQVLKVRQDDDEQLNDYVKRFKQAKDNIKGTIGTEFLKGFMEKTKE